MRETENSNWGGERRRSEQRSAVTCLREKLSCKIESKLD